MAGPRPTLLLTLLAALLAVQQATGQAAVKNCYTCYGNAGDTTCLDSPEKVTQGAAYLPCKRKYCTIVRQEYTSKPGVANEITRGCEMVLPGHGKSVDDEFTTYYWTCTTNLCNTGDGTKPPAGGGGGGGGDVAYILVDGIAGASSTTACIATLAGLMMLLYGLR